MRFKTITLHIIPLGKQTPAFMPKGSKPAVRWTSKKDTKSIFEVAEKVLQSNPHQTHVIVQSGYEECMECESEKLIAAVTAFAEQMTRTRPECS